MQIKDRPEFKRKGMVLTMPPTQTVAEAAALMSDKNYGAVIVGSGDGPPLGIVTERDFMRRVLAKKLDPATTTLGDVMTTDLRLAKPEDDLLDWLRQMSNDRFRHVPVVDEAGRVVNIMSQGDFVSYTWPQLMTQMTQRAKATFDVNPSIFTTFAVGVILLLILIAAIIAFT